MADSTIGKNKGRPCGFDRGMALETALRIFWERGYAPASVADLCGAMGINPPSLYAAFGSKALLFMEAARHYEETYWAEPAKRFMAEKDVYKAVSDFFLESAHILLSPNTPCGSMFVLAAINIGEDEKEIADFLRQYRMRTKTMFTARLKQAIKDGQIPADTDVPSLAGALNAMLEGMSLQAREDIFLSELKAMAAYALHMLP